MHLTMLEHSYPSDVCKYSKQVRDLRLSMTSDPLIFPLQYGMIKLCVSHLSIVHEI